MLTNSQLFSFSAVNHQLFFLLFQIANYFLFQQLIINYCLLVDKFVELEKFPVDATEQALLLQSVNEDKSRQHLQVHFYQFNY